MKDHDILISIGLTDIQVVKRYLRYVKPFQGPLILAGGLLLLATVFQLTMPVLTGFIIDHILLDKRPSVLNLIVLLLVCVTAAHLISNFVRSFLLLKVKIKIYVRLQRQLIRQISRLSFTYASSKQTGYLASRLLDDPSHVYELAADNVLAFVQHSLTFLVALLIMMWLNWHAALCSLLIIPAYLGVGSAFLNKLRKINAISIEKEAQVSKLLYENLSGLYTINACGAEAQMMKRFFRAQKDAIRARWAQFLLGSKASIARNFTSALGPLVVLWYGGMLVIRGELSIGELVALSAVFGHLFNSARSLSAMHLSLQKAVICLQRIFEILDAEPAIREQEPAIGLRDLKHGIEFSNVSFSYDGRTQILKEVNLWIPVGKVVALVGPSGAGKTTIAHLLLRFYDPTSGCILFDRQDLKTFSIRSLRQTVAIVPQDVFLFSMSILENIRLGRRWASEREVIAAAELADAHEFIQMLPKGYQTVVGERGMTLSGGQRQRIALARALLRDPKVLILDEAASSIDSASEGLICETVRRLTSMQRITTIIIAHRLSTIMQADLIYFIDQGRVIAKGDHQALLECCPPYVELLKFQLSAVSCNTSGNFAAT